MALNPPSNNKQRIIYKNKKKEETMRRLRFVMIMVLVLSISLAACSKITDNNDNTNTEPAIFEAEIIETGDRLLVAPDEDSSEYKSSDKISVGLLETEFFDDKGEKVSSDIFKPGDRIKIYYNGIIAESYPAQISADKIELIGQNQ
jgi:hypothetical protein